MYDERLLGKFRAALKTADKVLKTELYKGMNRATRTLRKDVKDAARDRLPKRGGLNKRVARSRISVRRRLNARNPRVTIATTGNPVQQVWSIDRGLVRHPVYGNREVWRTTKVTPGFWTDTLQREAPTVRREFQKAINLFIHRVTGGK